jgi:hypothetical protein
VQEELRATAATVPAMAAIFLKWMGLFMALRELKARKFRILEVCFESGNTTFEQISILQHFPHFANLK